MGKTTTVTCDQCGADLTWTCNSVNYRIALTNEHIPSGDGPITDMMIYPALKRDLYFCGVRCLRPYVAEKLSV